MKNKIIKSTKNEKRIVIGALFSLISLIGVCQNIGINTMGNAPNASAALDIDINQKGLLVPRMSTANRNAIVSPAHSLLIFNTTTDCFEAWNQSTLTWVAFGCINCQLPGVFSTSAATNIAGISFDANWSASAGATSYYLDVATDVGFTAFVAGYNNVYMGNVTTSSVAGLTCGTYYYRVRANNACGTSANSGTITVTTNPPSVPAIPTAATHTPCQTQIVWNWNASAGATGYKYNTVNNYSTATDNLTSTSFTQTGLSCNTAYTLYVWAYNACGNSIAATLNENTSACFIVATGGTITTDGNFKVHTFNSSGTFTVTAGCANVEYLVVAGGGGGTGFLGGGGGAGGMRTGTGFAVTIQAYTITVGAGGAVDASGSNSVFSTITSAGGGVGGSFGCGNGGSGGSGGGAGAQGTCSGGTGNTPSTSPSQGNNGGNTTGGICGGAGGGGAGAVGANNSGTTGGAGGAGAASSISGFSVTYAGGGGGGGRLALGGAGGTGGGGAGGGDNGVLAIAGTANSGGGGGAHGYQNGTGAAGGSGIVIVRYQFQ